MAYLNLGSLLLGLTAWTLPAISLLKKNKAEHKNWVLFAIISLSACAASLFLQILYGNHLVNIGDWSALMDIRWGVAFVSSALLVVTFALNIAAVVVYSKIFNK